LTFFGHDSILSRVGVSIKIGAVHRHAKNSSHPERRRLGPSRRVMGLVRGCGGFILATVGVVAGR
jgi:hypothetical protein